MPEEKEEIKQEIKEEDLEKVAGGKQVMCGCGNWCFTDKNGYITCPKCGFSNKGW